MKTLIIAFAFFCIVAFTQSSNANSINVNSNCTYTEYSESFVAGGKKKKVKSKKRKKHKKSAAAGGGIF